jgi:hypothetical protein
MRDLTIPVNENFGANCTIAPATEEKGGYYVIFADIRLCGNGPNRNVKVCPDNFNYSREAIWYITGMPNGYHISRGNMCITRMADEIGFKQKEELDGFKSQELDDIVHNVNEDAKNYEKTIGKNLRPE